MFKKFKEDMELEIGSVHVSDLEEVRRDVNVAI